MKVDVLLGLQWGDEGKGKIVDVLTPDYDVISRFQGGPNAGHSLEFNNIKHVLHTIPSGIFHKESLNIIGNGVVIDPIIFKNEIDQLEKLAGKIDNLIISKKAHLIIPTHRILDAASEQAKGDTKIGSTLKGIGPTYMDKTGRNGLRVGDIISGKFKEKYEALKSKHLNMLKMYDFKFSIDDYEKGFLEGIESIKKFKIIDSEFEINDLIQDEKKILAEGAQGTLLDIDFGSYPFVTSSNIIRTDKPITSGEILLLSKDVSFNTFLIQGDVSYTSGVYELNGDFSKKFMFHYFNANKKSMTAKYYTGSTIKHASIKELGKEILNIPQLEKQQQIGSLVNNIDSLETFSSFELNKYIKTKSYLLNELF